jgi:hypothetical protein
LHQGGKEFLGEANSKTKWDHMCQRQPSKWGSSRIMIEREGGFSSLLAVPSSRCTWVATSAANPHLVMVCISVNRHLKFTCLNLTHLRTSIFSFCLYGVMECVYIGGSAPALAPMPQRLDVFAVRDILGAPVVLRDRQKPKAY